MRTSSQVGFFQLGFRSRAAGWYVTITGTPRNRWIWLRSAPSDCLVLSSVCAAVPPIARIARGLTRSIWRNRYGRQAAIDLPRERDLGEQLACLADERSPGLVFHA